MIIILRHMSSSQNYTITFKLMSKSSYHTPVLNDIILMNPKLSWRILLVSSSCWSHVQSMYRISLGKWYDHGTPCRPSSRSRETEHITKNRTSLQIWQKDKNQTHQGGWGTSDKYCSLPARDKNLSYNISATHQSCGTGHILSLSFAYTQLI